MMHVEYVYECDGCGEGCDTEVEDDLPEGWAAIKDGVFGTHYCPECAPPPAED